MRGRGIRLAFVFALAFGLGGCETSDLMDKITDLNPFGDFKKPIPGERKAVFPEGVPGVPQGVPPHMIRGAQPQPDATAPLAEAAQAEEAAKVKEPEKPKAKPKAKPKPRQAARPKPPESEPAPPVQSAPAAQSPWPAPPAQQPAPAPWPTQQSQQLPSPWPAPPPAQTTPRLQ